MGEIDRDLIDHLQQRVTRLEWRLALSVGCNIVQVGVILLAALAFAASAFGSDPLNEDLQVAAADALAMSNHTGGHAKVRYLSLYAIPPEDRPRAAQAISVLCHQLSHAGIPLQPSRVTDTLLRVQIELFDPFGVGWEQAWEKIIPADRRWHIDAKTAVAVDVAEAYLNTPGQGVGWFTVKVLSESPLKVQHSGLVYSVTDRKNFRAAQKVKADAIYGSWVDIKAAQQLADLTGSEGALLDARDFAYAAAFTPLYYEFRNSPKTLAEWRAKWGETADNGFGLFGVRGANIDRSNVTFAPRGIQRWRLSVWETFDSDKSKEYTDDKNPFVFPSRDAKIDATEALALQPNGGLDCFISDGAGNRVDAVPAAVAIDTSYGVRELRPGLSCWSCHCKVVGESETSGFLDFRDQQTAKRAATKDKLLASKLAAYYSDVDRLGRDLQKDRADFRAGILACTADPSIEHAMEPSEAFAALNWLVAQVIDEPVDPVRACWELGLDPTVDAQAVLYAHLGGTARDGLVDVLNGDEVTYYRFRNAMPEAFERIASYRHAQAENDHEEND